MAETRTGSRTETREEFELDAAQGVAGTALVVDDEESVRSVVSRMLKIIGFNVLTAADGLQGVEVFQEHCDEVCVVILDMMMPRMTGDEAFAIIRQLSHDTKVIISSGLPEKQAMAGFDDNGPDGFVQKPCRLATLRAILDEVLPDSTANASPWGGGTDGIDPGILTRN